MSGIFKPFRRQNNLSRSSVSSGLELIQTWNRPDHPLVRAVRSDAVKRLTFCLGTKNLLAHALEMRTAAEYKGVRVTRQPDRGISSEKATSRGDSGVFCRSANGPNEDCGTDRPSYHQTLMRGQMFSYNFSQGGKKGKRVSTEHKTTNLMNSLW